MKFATVLILAGVTTAWAADPVPMNIKTGQWETTVTRQISGPATAGRSMPAIPADKLAQLPPEQRARIEAMLANAASGGPRTTVTKSCVTQENLSQMRSEETSRPNCKNTVLTSTSTKQVIKSECEFAGVKRMTTATFEAVSSDSTKFTIVSDPTDSASASSAGMAAASVNISGTSKWLGPVCSDAK